MIKCSFSFAGGMAFDSYDRFGFIYVESDDTFAASIKKASSDSSIDLYKYYQDGFDYKIKFVVMKHNNRNANQNIEYFLTHTHNTSNVLRNIVYTNEYKGVQIAGIFKSINETDLKLNNDNDLDDCVVVELTLRVLSPTSCNFDYKPT